LELHHRCTGVGIYLLLIKDQKQTRAKDGYKVTKKDLKINMRIYRYEEELNNAKIRFRRNL
jgi:hypothetical protein